MKYMDCNDFLRPSNASRRAAITANLTRSATAEEAAGGDKERGPAAPASGTADQHDGRHGPVIDTGNAETLVDIAYIPPVERRNTD